MSPGDPCHVCCLELRTVVIVNWEGQGKTKGRWVVLYLPVLSRVNLPASTDTWSKYQYPCLNLSLNYLTVGRYPSTSAGDENFSQNTARESHHFPAFSTLAHGVAGQWRSNLDVVLSSPHGQHHRNRNHYTNPSSNTSILNCQAGCIPSSTTGGTRSGSETPAGYSWVVHPIIDTVRLAWRCPTQPICQTVRHWNLSPSDFGVSRHARL